MLVNKKTDCESSEAETSSTLRKEMNDLLESLIKQIVDAPESVSVSYRQGERTTVFEVSCSRVCMAKLIGSKGRTVNALRILVTSIMAKHGARAVIEIPNYPPGPHLD
ncbi:KH domain-containing protein [Bdellovibrio bacteriovorus]|uniref:KH domain-containing protein n=1 Tax=Bdellovibrio bacteriovorus TaxID=959 RepID=UPI0035A663FF